MSSFRSVLGRHNCLMSSFRSVLGNLYHTAGEDSKISIWTRACCSKWSGWGFAHQLVVTRPSLLCLWRYVYIAYIAKRKFKKRCVNFEIYPFLGPQILPTVLGPKNVRNPKLLNTLGLEVSCTPKTYHPKHRSPQEMWLEDYWTFKGVGNAHKPSNINIWRFLKMVCFPRNHPF